MTIKYTNIHNLPPEVVAALTGDYYTDESEEAFDESTSTITAPIQQTILKRRYPDKLKEYDVIDLFWQFLGSISHNVLERSWHESMGGFVERRLYLDLCGRKLSGKLDRYIAPHIRDYKSTKVYKIMKGDYSEWEKGQNVYAYLCRMNGLPVESLSIIALLFDWKKTEAFKKNYPKAPIVTIPLKLWDINTQENYVMNRLTCLNDAADLTDEELTAKYPCSQVEQWADVKDYAILKPGGKRAVKCYDTLEEAQQHPLKGEEYIEKRMTPRTRCLHYCPVSLVCLQHKQLLKEEGVTDEQEQQCEDLVF